MKYIVIPVIALLLVTGVFVLLLHRPPVDPGADHTMPVSIPPSSNAPEVQGAPESFRNGTTEATGAPSVPAPETTRPTLTASSADAPRLSTPATQPSSAIVSSPVTPDGNGPLPSTVPEDLSTPVATEATVTNVAPESSSTGVTLEGPSTPVPVENPLTPLTPVTVDNDQKQSIGLAALEKAAKENKYLFVFCSDNDSPATVEAKTAFESAVSNMSDTIHWTSIDKNQPSEKEALDRFRIVRAPMPIIVAIAPNGAITGALYREKLKEPVLEDLMAGPAEEQCMKFLQEGKVVLACIQNAVTKSNDLAMQGVNDFKADNRFAEVTEIVTLDPADAVDQRFLAKLGIEPTMEEATTAFLAPPRALLKTFTGATTKDTLVTNIMTASKGGCGGGKCAPGKCGPKTVAKAN